MKPLLWIKKFCKRAYNAVCSRFWNLWDGCIDRRICGMSLVRTVPSIFRDDKNGIGGTSSQQTHYVFLKRVFAHVRLTPDDRLMDVGCGKGRVLAFLIKQKCPCRLYGIEHNPEVGKIAAEWTKRYDRVSVRIGDAFQTDYNDYTVLTLARPFLQVTHAQFVRQLEETLTHPITFVSWYDQGNVRLMKDRPGWHLEDRGILYRVCGIKAASCPQTYTVWTYDPRERKKTEEANTAAQ